MHRHQHVAWAKTWHPRFLLDWNNPGACSVKAVPPFQVTVPSADPRSNRVYLRKHAAVYGPCTGTTARSSRDTEIDWAQLSQPERLWKGKGALAFPHHLAVQLQRVPHGPQLHDMAIRSVCQAVSIVIQARQKQSWLSMARSHNSQ